MGMASFDVNETTVNVRVHFLFSLAKVAQLPNGTFLILYVRKKKSNSLET